MDEEKPIHREVAGLLALVAIPAALFFFGISYAQSVPEPDPTYTPAPTSAPPTPTPTPAPTDIPRAISQAIQATLYPSPSPTPVLVYDGPDAWARDVVPPLYPVNYEDDIRENGYCHEIYTPPYEFCPPGLITRESAFYTPPSDFTGALSSYTAGAMERMCERNGPCTGYKGGVALVSCATIGKTVWLRIPPGSWRGPYLVVDCGAQIHQYFHHTVVHLAVEIGYKTAVGWRSHAPYVEVHIGGGPPSSFSGGDIGWWWVHYALEWKEQDS